MSGYGKPKSGRKASGRARVELSCRDAVSFLDDYLDHRLEAGLLKRFEKHLSDCPWCVDFLSTYRKSIELSRHLPYEEMPAAVRSRVESFLRRNLRRH